MELVGNRYSLEQTIGAGGMGTVYRARDTRTNGVVAVKMLHPQFLGRPTYIRRFKLEARLACSLDHPNVCAGLDSGEHLGTPYLVMELLEGHSVAELVFQRGHRFNCESALSVLVQAAAGLDAMVTLEGVVAHRDLSSANIFVNSSGTVKIADFGIAKLETGNETGTGSFLGNVNYMSPEQIMDPKSVDVRSDLYSLGVVLYEMLAGTHPFDGSPTEIAGKHLHAYPPTPPVSGKHADLCLRVLKKLLSKSPDDRFESPRALISYITAEMPDIQPVIARKRIGRTGLPIAVTLFTVLAVAALATGIAKPGVSSSGRQDGGLAAAASDETTAESQEGSWDWGHPAISGPDGVAEGERFVIAVDGLNASEVVVRGTPGVKLEKDSYTLTRDGSGFRGNLRFMGCEEPRASFDLLLEARNEAGETRTWKAYGIDILRTPRGTSHGTVPPTVRVEVIVNE